MTVKSSRIDNPGRTTLWSDGLGRASTRAAQVLLLLLLAVVLVYGLVQVRLVVIPVLLALILAAAIAPLVNWLRRKGWPSAAATGLSFFMLLLLLVGVIAGIVYTVMGELDDLLTGAAEGVEELYELVQEGPLPVDEQQIRQARDAAVDFVTSSAAGAGALSGLSAVGSFFTGLILMVVILFFFLKDGDRIWGFTLRAFKEERLVKARRVGKDSLTVLGGYVRGTAIVALVDSLFIGLALFFLGVPLVIPLAAVVFIGAFIPLVGATLAGALAALIALVTNGPVTALIVVAVVILVNQLEGNLLEPVVMGRTLSVHPLVILVALAAGTILAGIIGAILSVPLTAVGWAAIKAWNGDPDDRITDQEIERAEYKTLRDERGQSISATPEDELPPQKSETSETAAAEDPAPNEHSHGTRPEADQ